MNETVIIVKEDVMLAVVSEVSDREEGGCELRYPQSIGYEGRYDPRRGFHQITNSPSTNCWYD